MTKKNFASRKTSDRGPPIWVQPRAPDGLKTALLFPKIYSLCKVCLIVNPAWTGLKHLIRPRQDSAIYWGSYIWKLISTQKFKSAYIIVHTLIQFEYTQSRRSSVIHPLTSLIRRMTSPSSVSSTAGASRSTRSSWRTCSSAERWTQNDSEVCRQPSTRTF